MGEKTNQMEQYLNLLREIKEKGTWKNPARSNMPKTLSLFGAQYRCNLSYGFPILTTKKVSLRNISTELIWFLRGGSPLNIKYIVDNGCNIWNQDAYGYYLKKHSEYRHKEEIKTPISLERFNELIKSAPDEGSLSNWFFGSDCGYTLGDCPLGYELWRNFNGVDQIASLISSLKSNPEGRRHLLTAYDPSITDFALAPCHVIAQFNCREIHITDIVKLAPKEICDYELDLWLESQPKYYLDCQLYQRSCDVFLGVPYNTASYSLLTHIIAEICGFAVGDFIHTFGDVHIYENHMDAVDEQLKRMPDKLPKLKLREGFKFNINAFKCTNNIKGFIDNLLSEDFSLEGYHPQQSIKAELKTGL